MPGMYKREGVVSMSAFLISGEIHYFRVPREDWAKRLDLLLASGATCVATYVPWGLHEPEEGRFEFSSGPKNDLEGFLNLCREKGVDVIARPGPYQYSELRYCGLPAWLCENHPEIMAQDRQGNAYNNFAVSYLHPLFLEKAGRWFQAVLPILARHQKSRGGAIRHLQIDNEMCFHEWFGGWDYHRDVMGWGQPTGRWADFQKKRPRAAYHDFYFSAVAEYAGILARWIRGAGIDCALMHNAANPNMVPYFRDTVREIGGDFLLGVDMYFNLGMDFEANNPTPVFAANGFLGFEQLRLMGFTPTVLEMQAGNCADWPPTTPENLACWYNTCLAMGMKGVNWYVFTGGPNPEGLGGDGDLYDYRAAVGPTGDIRPSYAVLRDFSVFVRAHGWLSDAEMEHDYLLGLDWAHPRGKNDKSPDFGNAAAWALLRKGVLITGFCASRAPKLVDLALDDWVCDTGKPLIVCASRKMPRGIQENIVRYIKGGGSAVIAPLIPETDENGDRCAILKDFLGAGACEEIKGAVDYCFGGFSNIACETAFTCAVPEGGTQLALDRFTGRPTGFEASFPGGGKVIWLGMAWKHAKRVHEALFDALMERLGAPEPAVRCDNPNVWAVQRSHGGKRCLFAMNLFASPMEATVTPRGREAIRLSLEPMETRILLL